MTVAVLFPGQGAYAPEPARSLAEAFPEIAQVYAEVDAGAQAAGAAPVSDLLLAAQPPSAAELIGQAPESLQLAIYAVSVALARLIGRTSDWTSVCMGHSLGEVAALTAGGALSAEVGGQVVAHRSHALRAVDGQGGMVALGCTADRADALLALVGSPDLAVAALNARDQTVVSGPHAALRVVQAVASAVGVSVGVLPSPYAFHNPALQGVADDFTARIATLPMGHLVRPVYSPVLGRYYDNADDLRVLIPTHMVRPVNFTAAVRQLRAAGVTTFLECASGSTLGTLAGRAAERVETLTAAQRGNERASVAQAQMLLQGPNVTVVRPDPATAVTPRDPAHAEGNLMSVTAAPAAIPASPQPIGTADRRQLFAELADMYAEALEYPAEVFTEDVALEAELGVDSVKQTELFARTVERYQLPQPSDAIQLAQYDTMGKVVDLVWSMMPMTNAAQATALVGAA